VKRYLTLIALLTAVGGAIAMGLTRESHHAKQLTMVRDSLQTALQHVDRSESLLFEAAEARTGHLRLIDSLLKARRVTPVIPRRQYTPVDSVDIPDTLLIRVTAERDTAVSDVAMLALKVRSDSVTFVELDHVMSAHFADDSVRYGALRAQLDSTRRVLEATRRIAKPSKLRRFIAGVGTTTLATGAFVLGVIVGTR
jgi:hypothetical protein